LQATLATPKRLRASGSTSKMGISLLNKVEVVLEGVVEDRSRAEKVSIDDVLLK
jgi:hypothetical protein